MKDIPVMRRTIGLVLMMVGSAWFLMAMGILQSSIIRDSVPWAIVGAAIAIAGLATLYWPPWKAMQRPVPPEPSSSADDAPSS